ncbi:MAG: HD domain-containing protein [Polyangiaceae bacterium]
MDRPRDRMTADITVRARQFATEKHASQRYGDKPYTVHLAAVREVLRGIGIEDDDALAAAAWLHDVVEDTGTPREEVAARFGEHVASLVWAVTGVGSSRKERNADAYAKIRAFPEAATLKLADRIANVEASARAPDKLAMYRREHPGFEAALAGLGTPALWGRLRAALSVTP